MGNREKKIHNNEDSHNFHVEHTRKRRVGRLFRIQNKRDRGGVVKNAKQEKIWSMGAQDDDKEGVGEVRQ